MSVLSCPESPDGPVSDPSQKLPVRELTRQAGGVLSGQTGRGDGGVGGGRGGRAALKARLCGDAIRQTDEGQ